VWQRAKSSWLSFSPSWVPHGASSRRRGYRARKHQECSASPDAVCNDDAQLLRLHEALDELESVDSRVVQVVEMKYFPGLSVRQISPCTRRGGGHGMARLGGKHGCFWLLP
jgi:ECF sigma factor